MTALDIIVLFLIGSGAVFGFLRGFVQEALALIAWILIIAAVRIFHAPATAALSEPIGTEAGAAVLAFLAIVIVTFAFGKWIAKSIGKKSRKSVLGPIDRVLGFGFGMLKGLILATLVFLLLVMGYETLFGEKEPRPDWMVKSRTYALLNASGNAMSEFVREHRDTFETDVAE
ncbi:CvpA family protein [Sphingorhabdus sp. IMCC26285]|uniref:CvpA family protein n=1 Tax=Sphingorhabdus profundilacus TaxID=2509718 RepID=A0A6I4M4H9_9SPHN|nr:CvpA family protein [Sphingorhabdus profundilacus]MVZ97498.1 CvpA family protein [Sphingorhabdus profundilacus]